MVHVGLDFTIRVFPLADEEFKQPWVPFLSHQLLSPTVLNEGIAGLLDVVSVLPKLSVGHLVENFVPGHIEPLKFHEAHPWKD